jgi:hypothetical protein
MIYKVRCSKIGEIMAPITKADEEAGHTLPKGARSHVDRWVDEVYNGIEYDYFSKYTEKGHRVEEESIEAIKSYFFLDPSLSKNTESYEDEYITGTPDLLDVDAVFDAKSNWSTNTFPDPNKTLWEINRKYWLQMQGYMHLTHLPKAYVCYVLCDTPEDLLDGEYQEKYSSWPIIDRVRAYEVDYDPDVIDSVIERVKLIREYIKDFYVDIS